MLNIKIVDSDGSEKFSTGEYVFRLESQGTKSLDKESEDSLLKVSSIIYELWEIDQVIDSLHYLHPIKDAPTSKKVLWFIEKNKLIDTSLKDLSETKDTFLKDLRETKDSSPPERVKITLRRKKTNSWQDWLVFDF